MEPVTILPLPDDATLTPSSVHECIDRIPCAGCGETSLENVRPVVSPLFGQHGSPCPYLVNLSEVMKSAGADHPLLKYPCSAYDGIASGRFGDFIEGKYEGDGHKDFEVFRELQGVIDTVIEILTTYHIFPVIRLPEVHPDDIGSKTYLACPGVGDKRIVVFGIPLPAFKLDGLGHLRERVPRNGDIGRAFLKAVDGSLADGGKHDIDGLYFRRRGNGGEEIDGVGHIRLLSHKYVPHTLHQMESVRILQGYGLAASVLLGQLDGATGTENAVTHCVLRHHEGGLIDHVEVGTGLLDGEVLQLDRTDGFALESETHGVGEVTIVGVLFAGHSFDVGAGQVVGLDELDARNFVDDTLGEVTGGVPIRVQNLGILSQKIIVGGTKNEVALPFKDVLLIPGLGAGEHGGNEVFSGIGGRNLNLGTAGFIVDETGGTGGQNTYAHGLLVELTSKSEAELTGVFGTHVIMVLGIVEVINGHVGDKQVIYVDDTLGGGNLVAAENGGAGSVITGRSLAEDGEGSGLAVADGTHTVQVLHDIHFFKSGEDFTAEDFHEEGITFTGEFILTGKGKSKVCHKTPFYVLRLKSNPHHPHEKRQDIIQRHLRDGDIGEVENNEGTDDESKGHIGGQYPAKEAHPEFEIGDRGILKFQFTEFSLSLQNLVLIRSHLAEDTGKRLEDAQGRRDDVHWSILLMMMVRVRTSPPSPQGTEGTRSCVSS
nr:MAG TPA: hypothetical protein [Caudoviricetes sp.]